MIWAQTTSGVIGHEGGMPWHVPEDLAHFKKHTHGHPVIMGRRTWESFPEQFRPLPGRFNIIVSTTLELSAEDAANEEVALIDTLEEAYAVAAEHATQDLIWVIGGATLYTVAMDHADLIERTLFHAPGGEVPGDTHAPAIDPDVWELTHREPAGDSWPVSASGRPEGITYCFERFERRVTP